MLLFVTLCFGLVVPGPLALWPVLLPTKFGTTVILSVRSELGQDQSH